MDVKYRVKVKNTGTINFLFQGPEEFVNLNQVNRKVGSIRSSVAGDYNICFENMIPKTIEYVDFEVIIEGEVDYVDDNDSDINQACPGQHMISWNDRLSESFPTIIHERSMIKIVDCQATMCNRIEV